MKLNITDVAKFNPYHDARGRFTTGSGATSFTIRTKDPNKQYMADRAVAREKERHTQSASQSLHNESFNDIFGDRRTQEVQDQVHSTENKDITKVWDEHFPQMAYQSTHGVSSYNCTFQIVRLDQSHCDENELDARNEVIYHETAHAIDHMAATKHGKNGRLGATFSEMFEDGAFIQTLHKEYDALEKKYKARLEAESGGKVTIAEARDYMRKELAYDWKDSTFGGIRQSKDRQEWGNTWDIMQGCSKSKVQFPVGHDKKYYQGKFSDNHLGAEAFAEMYSTTISSPKSLKRIKEYFPKSYKVFERMLGAM